MAHEEHRLENGKGYKWRWGRDIIQAPFAVILGALNALGNDASSAFCSRYTLSARQYMLDAQPFFLEGNKIDGYDYYW